MSPPSAAIARSAAARASSGVRSISTLAFTAISRAAASEDDRGDDQRGDRVALVRSPLWRRAARRARPAEPSHVGGEVPGVGAQRGAVVAAGGDAARRVVRLTSSTSATPITANWYQRMLGGGAAFDQVADRLDRDDQPAGEQDRGLAERAEVLGAAVAVGVAAVGGPPAEAHREEGEHGGDHVAAGLDPRRDQPEAVGREARRPSFSATSSAAAAIETSVVRRAPLGRCAVLASLGATPAEGA